MSQTAVTLDEIVLSRLDVDHEAIVASPLMEATLDEQRLEGTTLRVVVKAIPREVVAKTIDVQATNLAKLYKRKYLSRVQSEDISDLTATWAEMRNVFMGDVELLNEWLMTPLPSLNGRPPRELLQTLAGRKVLKEQLNRLCYGDFS
ncbi:MbcA/ParS/Xre antitoxin family protein [Vibrio tubiashii]|uniref:antitoxin Xre/MbcA/ParS toxin-binding domain-containing protein n=1 Tax=Vibrio tubiashii TaxID=29498 RepID=UPI001EFDC734|nr:MbcA/ParS/Xre antitoxin family protein [Vibrio tubiashii]MCG9579815.1 MbcA/ParS/Xre antitoxin family protein [Vibrio tubiashii]